MRPRHMAVSLEKPISVWAERMGKTIEEAYSCRKDIFEEIIRYQVSFAIPIVTVVLLRADEKRSADFEASLVSAVEILDALAQSDVLKEQSIKVTAMGRWYSLPGRAVESIRKVVETSAHHDRFFLNICLNYDPMDEITDSCRLIARRVKAGKMDPEAITPELIRENSYFSGFMPPDLAIINGDKRLGAFMACHSSEATLYFTNKPWPELNANDMKKAMDLFELVGNSAKARK